MYSFKYSPRPNTLARQRYPDDVSDEEKTRRIVALQALQREIQIELHAAAVGSEVDVLVDSISRRREWEAVGPHAWQHRRQSSRSARVAGADYSVRVTRAGAYSLAGEASSPGVSRPDQQRPLDTAGTEA